MCWIEIERPVIRVGGELTLENTGLVWSESSKFYEAPFHIKSNCGTLIIDDVGRQSVPTHSLLNRWIPASGKKDRFLNAEEWQSGRDALRATCGLLKQL